jgi:hypothetical protein
MESVDVTLVTVVPPLLTDSFAVMEISFAIGFEC